MEMDAGAEDKNVAACVDAGDRDDLEDSVTDHEADYDDDLDGEEMDDAGFDMHDGLEEPRIGMEFATCEEAFLFYRAYALREGFGVTIRSSRRSKRTNELIDGKFVCSRFGKRRIKSTVMHPRSSTKIECKAAMHVKKRAADRRWFTYIFVKEHNHELVRDEAEFRPRKRINTPVNKKIRAFHAVGVRAHKINAAPSKPSGGCLDAGHPDKDIRGELERERRLAIEAGDVQAMSEYFMHMMEENPNFFYDLDLNDEHHLRNVFWVDAKGRHDYVIFGDVVSFDTTYVANMYKMTFASFMGVNNHGQFILFGCALLADLTSSTIIWLLRTWLRAMDRQAPKAIITDQDKALKSAIAQVFPNSRHQYCLWHITRKIPEKLGYVTREHHNFMIKFNKCIYRSWTEEVFEKRWLKMTIRFDLKKDEWLQSLYEDRRFWVPTYVRDTCFAGISTSQRIETINSFFDKYMFRKTTLKEFVQRYEVALHDMYETESLADFQSWHTRPTLKSPSPYELQLSSVYTREIFNKFQDEIMGAHACFATKDKEDGSVVTFNVNDLEAKLNFVVSWNELKQEISCLCRLFEYKGFLCRHAIIVLQFSGATKIPSHYILKRWTREAKSGHTPSQNSNAAQSRVQRYNDICRRSISLAQEGSQSQESYTVALSILEQGLKRCVNANDSHRSDPTHGPHSVDKATDKPKGP